MGAALAVLALLIGWFALNRWVLPRLGIQTRAVPGACSREEQEAKDSGRRA